MAHGKDRFVRTLRFKFALVCVLLIAGMSVSAVTYADSIWVPLDLVAEGTFFAQNVTPLTSTTAPADGYVPRVWTDRNDYAPGEVVQIGGSGFAPNESVTLLVVHIDPNSLGASTGEARLSSEAMDPVYDHAGHTPWVVTAGADGRFQSTWLVQENSLNQMLLLSADQIGTGDHPALHADAIFTDANASANLDQCANDPFPSPSSDGCSASANDWVNGNLGGSKANYSEGDSIPYRMLFDNLTLASHTVIIEWDTTKGDKHALDYITTFNRTVATADPCLGVSGCSSGTFTTFPIPADPQVTGAGVTPVAGQFRLYGGTITGLSAYSYADGAGFTGDKSARISVTFTASQANPVLAWGGHIATRQDWGSGGSAVAISGSPYHTRLIDLDGSGGNQDRSLSAEAVIFPGSITIIKDAVPNDAQDFSFSTTGGLSPATFSLDDDSDPALSNTKSYTNIQTFTTYTVAEGAATGWALSFQTPVCTVSSPNGGSQSGSTGTRTVTINLEEGEDVTCTFVNTRTTGSLKLSKALTGGPAGYTGPFQINYDCDGTAFDGNKSVTAGSFETVTGIPTGTSCTISETLPTPPTGYSFGTPTFSPSNQVTITSAGATVEVTTNNTLTRDTGNLKLSKALTGGPAGYTGPFTINYDCDGTAFDGSKSVSAGSFATVTGIPTGTSCTISETPPSPPQGYTFGTPTFSPSNQVTITTAGATVEVTTNNTLTRDTGSLRILKTLSNPDGASVPASFTVNYNCGAGLTGQVSVAPGSPATVNNIPTGSSCSVTEVAPAAIPGFTWGTITYTPTSVTIDTKSATFDITVGNSILRDRGTFTIAKTLSNPDGANVPASFTVNYNCGLNTDGSTISGQKSIAPGSPATVTGVPTGNTCSVTEVAPAAIPGFTWGTITYTPASVVISSTSGTFTITVGNSITRDRGSLEIKKTLSNPDGASVPASFTVNYDCGGGLTGQVSVSPGSPATVNNIPTGSTCTVTEVAPAAIPGFTWGNITYTPTSVVITTKGQTYCITVGNSITRDRGSLRILKTLSNPDGASVPASFTVNYNCGTGYTGQVSVAPGAPATVNGIPTGNTCTVTEVAPAAIPGFTWGTVTYTPASVVIQTKEQTFDITVGNSISRDRGSLRILKTLSNPDGASVPATFDVNYDCGAGFTGTVSVAPGSPATVNNIPTGNTCTVAEVAPAVIPGFTWGTITYTPASVVIQTKEQTFDITVGNSITRDRGSLKIRKTLSNPDGANVPASFTVNYNCGTGYTGQVSISPTMSATINNIPTGNTCTVTEVAPAAIPNFTWGTITYTPASVEITTKGQTFYITVGNSITRDRGYLTLVKKVINDNGGTATLSDFTIASNYPAVLSFGTGDVNGTMTTYTSVPRLVPTGTYSLTEADFYGYSEGIWGCTGAAGSVVGTFNAGSVQVGKDENVVCTITNNDDPGTIVIIKNAKPAQGSFAFTTTGSGYNGFTLTGSTASNGNKNTQTLSAGTYKAKEGMQLSWILTGIGGSTDPLTPYNCVVTGSGGSTGVGDLVTQEVTISLKNGDTVTCTFENTGSGATRTQGFWATHPQLADIAWNGGSAFNHTFPGVVNVAGIGDKTLCGRTLTINALLGGIDGDPTPGNSELLGGFWASVSKTSTNGKRSGIEQSRMQALQQLLAAELNASAFGSTPANGSFAAWETAICGTQQNAINTAQSQAASFNSQGDNSTFTPGTSADSKNARLWSNISFWDVVKP